MLMSTLTCGAGLLWGCMYLFLLDETSAAGYPFAYSTVMTSCFVFFTGQGRYKSIVHLQLFLILALPICLQIHVGGTIKSGCVCLWSFLCPLGAALFCSTREARWFYVLYVCCMIATITSEQWFPPMFNHTGRIDRVGTVEIALFTMNVVGAMTITFAGALWFSSRLDVEYNRSEKLLSNVLPKSIAVRLKDGESHIIDHFDGVTILFADLVGFTKAASEYHPNFLVGNFLKDVFSAWDKICEEHSMEKIKTIGDAFMAVGGIQNDDDENFIETSHETAACAMIQVGIEMQMKLDEINHIYGLDFEMRVGLHSGEVIAGVIGLKKFAFDVWGDAVNTAARMESHGKAGFMHISEDTYEIVHRQCPHLHFTCRGDIEVKGKGIMTTYLIQLPKSYRKKVRRRSSLKTTRRNSLLRIEPELTALS